MGIYPLTLFSFKHAIKKYLIIIFMFMVFVYHKQTYPGKFQCDENVIKYFKLTK